MQCLCPVLHLLAPLKHAACRPFYAAATAQSAKGRLLGAQPTPPTRAPRALLLGGAPPTRTSGEELLAHAFRVAT
eukprot:CAMPEP_0171780254 /NCGR_PEP_ID=MMETSP0991-20121206/59504_1 /TAXON_ID=483369 /ORGANISM="non described non described, Strain CCMP2098" /LENGTH=74 /DNA_ID=CAMNT_0012387597 /DNA_START=13 /DNA_END=237 /DNA_ORIENTATION=-